MAVTSVTQLPRSSAAGEKPHAVTVRSGPSQSSAAKQARMKPTRATAGHGAWKIGSRGGGSGWVGSIDPK